MTRGHVIALARLLLCAAGLCGMASAAQARSARCYTSDEGSYPCEFFAQGRDGSFEIFAPGKPVYKLDVVAPGVASGYLNLGSRNVFLPGRYLRSGSEPGCWVSDANRSKICAW